MIDYALRLGVQMLAKQLAKFGARAPNQGVENRLMGLDGVGPAGMIPKIHQVTGAHDAQGQGIVVGGQQLVAGSFDNAPPLPCPLLQRRRGRRTTSSLFDSAKCV